MTQRGRHTWDMVVAYHACPKCGFIQENREGYTYRLGKYQKDLECPRCLYHYTLTKNVRMTPGPLFGEGDSAEVTWS